MIREKERSGIPGLLVVAAVLMAWALAVYRLVLSAQLELPPPVLGPAAAFMVGAFLLGGLFIVNPNEGRVLQLFGGYAGTARTPGLRWDNPFLSKKRISLRVRNFDSEHLKVNDSDGNPIEIAAVVVWKVVDSAEASFEVDDYEHFVRVQSEAALRSLASRYPYDGEDGVESLRGATEAVADHLKEEIEDRLQKAGVHVIEARISHLAYAPEIASAMLQRQQAAAVVAARRQIVEGAVGMVELALDRLKANQIIELDEERKAQMVSNLLVVLCSERGSQPVVNAGSIYQ